MNKIIKKLSKIHLEPAQLVLFVYIILLISKLVVPAIKIGIIEQISLVILQLLAFGFPAVAWYRLRTVKMDATHRQGYVKRLRVSPPKLSHLTVILAASFALMSGCLLLSINFSGESSLEGSFSLYDTFISKYNGTPLGALWLIIAYAALPAVCEELVFRSVLCAEYERYGVVCSVVMNTLWFGLIHFNFAKITVYIFAGLVLSLLLYATRSVAACMIAHFIYNVFGLFGQKYITEFYLTEGSLGIAVVILLIVLLLSAAAFCGGAKRLYEEYSKHDAPSEHREPTRKDELAPCFRKCLLTVAAAMCVAVFLVASTIQIFTK